MRRWFRGRRGKNAYETRVQQTARADDTRRKELAGAWLLEVNIPGVTADQRQMFGDAIAHMIARQTHKDITTRQHEIALFQRDFGAEWARRWQRILDRQKGPGG